MSTAPRLTPTLVADSPTAISSLRKPFLLPDTSTHSTLGAIWESKYEQTRRDLVDRALLVDPELRRVAIRVFAFVSFFVSMLAAAAFGAVMAVR